ncbi:MAG: pyridoxal-phosphate dependent enzyme, partial [Salibacteraceae bacterium]
MVQNREDFFQLPISLITEINGVKLFMKRDDLIHPHVSGNKLYKLRYNFIEAKKNGFDRILTFGGAFSNHLAATASYAQDQQLKCIGVVRGERPATINPTLKFCIDRGVELKFVSRSDYRQKTDAAFLDGLRSEFHNPFIIPEGGNNELGIKGSGEMLDERTTGFDAIICPIGTGTTVGGLLKAAAEHQRVIGLPVHKHADIMEDVRAMEPSLSDHFHKLTLWTDYHFGGYAKWDNRLLQFIQSFYSEFSIKLDPIYTGKAMFATM